MPAPLQLPFLVFIAMLCITVGLLAKNKLLFAHAARAFATPILLLLLSVITINNPPWHVHAPTIAYFATFYGAIILIFGFVHRPKEAEPVKLPVAALAKAYNPIIPTPLATAHTEPPISKTPQELYGAEIITVIGEVDSYTAVAFAASCHKVIRRKVPRVTVQISTHGGKVDYAWAMFEQLRLLAQVIDTKVLVVGPCQSAGVSLIMAVERSRRFATTNSEFMIHSTSNMGQPRDTLDPEQRARVDQCNEEWVKNIIAAGTYISPDDLEAIVDSGLCTYISASQALELGIIGGIV
jgi:ATP-dependent protease ClpP protease subunit